MVHIKEVEETSVKSKSNVPIGKINLMVVLQKVVFIFKTRLGSKRGFLIKFPKARDDRVFNPKPKKGRGSSPPTKNPTCRGCGKNYYGDCLIGNDNCFSCS